jgi:LysR family transcriptional regulator of gallate degradation
MDPRKLIYLASVIEHGSLAKAARHLSVSQPALSKSMDRLETELGTKLLERSAAGVSATKAGELVYSHARAIREEMDFAKARVDGVTSHTGVLTVGTLPSLASSVVPIAVGQWKTQYPDVLLRVVEKVQVELLLGLLRREFDFIIARTEFFDISFEGLKQRVLFRDRLRVFSRNGHPLLRKETLSWADIIEYPWVCPMVGWPQRNILEKLVASEGVEAPKKLVECGSIDFTKSLVAVSDHLAMLPDHCVKTTIGTNTITPLPITVPALKRDIAVIFREVAPLDNISQDLVEYIAATGTQLSGN